MSNILRLYSELDKDTGEYLMTRELNDDEYKGRYLEISKGLSPQQINKLNKKEEMKWFSQELGGFVLIQYVRNELLFNELNLDLGTLTRIIYLSTYIDYNDRNQNMLMKRGLYNQLQPMDRRDIQYSLKLRDTAFKKFMKEVKDKELLYQDENGSYIVNNKYFKKGKAKFSKREYTRLYINTIRSLYENSNTNQHKTLGYVFKLLPKMNYETNQICHNPEESNPKPMSFKEVAEYVGYNTSTKQNISAFKKALYNIYIEYDGKMYNLFRGIIIDNMGKEDETFFVINPLIIYAGSDFKIMDSVIGKMFFKERGQI